MPFWRGQGRFYPYHIPDLKNEHEDSSHFQEELSSVLTHHFNSRGYEQNAGVAAG